MTMISVHALAVLCGQDLKPSDPGDWSTYVGQLPVQALRLGLKRLGVPSITSGAAPGERMRHAIVGAEGRLRAWRARPLEILAYSLATASALERNPMETSFWTERDHQAVWDALWQTTSAPREVGDLRLVSPSPAIVQRVHFSPAVQLLMKGLLDPDEAADCQAAIHQVERALGTRAAHLLPQAALDAYVQLGVRAERAAGRVEALEDFLSLMPEDLTLAHRASLERIALRLRHPTSFARPARAAAVRAILDLLVRIPPKSLIDVAIELAPIVDALRKEPVESSTPIAESCGWLYYDNEHFLNNWD